MRAIIRVLALMAGGGLWAGCAVSEQPALRPGHPADPGAAEGTIPAMSRTLAIDNLPATTTRSVTTQPTGITPGHVHQHGGAK